MTGREAMLDGASSSGDVAASARAASSTDPAPGPAIPPLPPPADPPQAPPSTMGGQVARRRNEIRHDVGPNGHILKTMLPKAWMHIAGHVVVQ